MSAPANPDPAAESAPVPAGPALRIGRYVVERVIGTGAFATVYRARDERLGATVAVKLLADNHCLDPDIRARFIEEGRVLRRIDSPHVVRVYDVGETERLQPYLVLEHADRGTLAQRVEALRAGGWRPTIADVGAVATELAAAVTAVHAAGLVHRDLSPGNLLLRSGVPPRPVGGADHAPAGAALLRADERLLVADLGLSKDLARSSGLTVAGGTDGFRPPEQRAGPSRVDGRADVWALSAVLLWLVTGQPPPADGPVSATDLDRALVPLPLPAALARPLVTSLHDDPDRRHPDAATWLAAVEATLAPPPVRVPVRAAVPGSTRGRLLLGGAALAVAGALAGVVGANLAGGPDDTTGQSVARRDGGKVATSDQAGDASITLVGRPRADVGDTVTFTAEVDGIDHWAWLMPDGAVYADRPSVQLDPRSAGVASVTLVAVAPSGERLEVQHDLHLVEP